MMTKLILTFTLVTSFAGAHALAKSQEAKKRSVAKSYGSKNSVAKSKSSAKKSSIVKKSDKSSLQQLGAKLGTDYSFDDMSVRGRYQSAFEGMATVEDEKGLNDLLDYRTHYNDRVQKGKSQF